MQTERNFPVYSWEVSSGHAATGTERRRRMHKLFQITCRQRQNRLEYKLEYSWLQQPNPLISVPKQPCSLPFQDDTGW